MEIGHQIRQRRTELGWSQEELAEKVYVTRQTVSNWETERTYPDIHSLLLLSNLFQVSLDQLIKGDVTMMKEVIQQEEIAKLNRLSRIYALLLAATILTAAPLAFWLGWYGLIPWNLLAGVTLYCAFRVEKVKKANRLRTYREIVAFTQGKRLDELETREETGKWRYQQALLAVSTGIIALLGCGITAAICRMIMN